MKAIEEYKPELEGVLPKDEYFRLTRDPKTKTIPNNLLKNFANIPSDTTGDLFGQIYEYFLAEFARSEGQKGGEFFTPRSVVRLMVEIIEPHGGKVFDPACGSGGMFVQSAKFIEEHRRELSTNGKSSSVYVYGQEKTLETVNLAKMNLAVNGLRGEIKKGITYYDDHFNSFRAFDYVLANPPFNVDEVSLKAVEKDRRFNTYGVPRNKSKVKKADAGKETVPNANYLWINLFATSLKPKGRAALVMANSASDARHSEAEIRKRLIEENLIYAMLTLPSNMFYTVTLPATLWFFDRAKTDDHILFIDARNIFTQIDRAHREFLEEQIQNIAIISQLHKGRREKFVQLVDRYFAAGMERLVENKNRVEPVSAQLLEVLDDQSGKEAVAKLVKQWAGLNKLQARYQQYGSKNGDQKSVNAKNKAQHQLREAFDPFFAGLHECLKQLDKTVRQHEKQQAEQAQKNGKRLAPDRKTRALKSALEELHKEVKNAEMSYRHIHWLQERFPEAEYEDVTGLCKLASPAEVEEQEFSLNPGRYVGVVIEEDGRTEEEFVSELATLNDELRVDWMRSVEMAVIVSEEAGEEEKFKNQKLDIKSHRERMNRVDEHGHDVEYNFKDAEHPLQLVFVCAMWLTGFDAPTVSTMYLDKPMKDHTLMQTIARANRVTSFKINNVEKKNGDLIDYYNVFRNMKEALKNYARGEEGVDAAPVQDKQVLFQLLEESIAQGTQFCAEREIDLGKIMKSNDVFKNVDLFGKYADRLLMKDEWRQAFAVYENTITSLFEACKPEIVGNPVVRSIAVFQYLRGVVDSIIEQKDIQAISTRISDLLDESVVVDGSTDLKQSKPEFVIKQSGRIWDLSKLDFEKLAAEFKEVNYKNIEIADLRAFIQQKLDQMMQQNATRADFAQRLQEIIDRYNSGSSSVDNYFEELVKFAKDLKEESERHIREGLSEDELEIFDLLKKDKMTKDETQKVRLAAKSLLQRLLKEPPPVLIQDWFKDSQSKERVKSTVQEVLNTHLPESYDRALFTKKCDAVFELMLNYASQGLKWAA